MELGPRVVPADLVSGEAGGVTATVVTVAQGVTSLTSTITALPLGRLSGSLTPPGALLEFAEEGGREAKSDLGSKLALSVDPSLARTTPTPLIEEDNPRLLISIPEYSALNRGHPRELKVRRSGARRTVFTWSDSDIRVAVVAGTPSSEGLHLVDDPQERRVEATLRVAPHQGLNSAGVLHLCYLPNQNHSDWVDDFLCRTMPRQI
jgi:hypothetical protein